MSIYLTIQHIYQMNSFIQKHYFELQTLSGLLNPEIAPSYEKPVFLSYGRSAGPAAQRKLPGCRGRGLFRPVGIPFWGN